MAKKKGNGKGIDWEHWKNRQSSLRRGSRWTLGDVSRIFLLPFKHAGRWECYSEETLHFNPTPDIKVAVCGGPDCELCEVLPDLPKRIASDLNPARRCNAHIVDADDLDSGLQPASLPPSVIDQIMTITVQNAKRARSPMGILDPRRAYAFVITRSGSGNRCRYHVELDDKPESIEAYIDTSAITDLMESARDPDHDQLAQIAEELTEGMRHRGKGR